MSAKDHEAVVRFLLSYNRLRDIIDDDPAELVALAHDDPTLTDLCIQLGDAALALRLSERRVAELFAAPADPHFVAAWRDYEERYQRPLATIYLRSLGFLWDTPETESSTDFFRAWSVAAEEAAERAQALQEIIDFAQEQIEQEHRGFGPDFVERVGDGIAEWHRFRESAGFDIGGAFRRRALVPFVLVPRHVAKGHGDREKISLFTHLRQAHDAFIFGVPFASLALMRAILEGVLRDHYGGTGDLCDMIDQVRGLPPEASRAKLHRLRMLANDIVHLKQEKVRLPADLERELLSFLHGLRALIENAPLNGTSSRRTPHRG